MAQDPGIFMNLMTDFAFKRLFGSIERKPILIRFLNIIFADDNLRVEDVTLHDKEVLPDDGEGKTILYDVFCTHNGGPEHFILEMQQVYHPYFEDRTVFYTAKAIATQLKKGEVYKISPVYSVFLVDFHFRHMHRHGFHDVRLIDSRTHEVFSDKLRMLFVHLNEAKKDWDDCKTEFDKIVYIIKNMHMMDKESKAYKSGEFEDMFEEAELANMVHEDTVRYSESRLKLQEMQEAIDYAAHESREEGREEGRQEERMSLAEQMLSRGYPREEILSLTGISFD